MLHYKLRITWSATEATEEQIEQILEKDCQSFAYVEEKPKEEGRHYHYYLITDLLDATLRSHIRPVVGAGKSGGGGGNPAYSLKEMHMEDEEIFAVAYLAYMVKEGLVITSEFFPTAWLPSAIELDLAKKKEYKEKQKLKKKTVYAIIDERIKALFDDPDPRETHRRDNEDYVYHVIFDAVYEHYLESGARYSLSMLESFIFTFMCKYNEDYHNVVSGLIRKRIFP